MALKMDNLLKIYIMVFSEMLLIRLVETRRCDDAPLNERKTNVCR